MGGRRLSIASSISESSSSFLSEEDLHVLSDDQLLSVHEEVKKSLADLQEDIDLYNRFLASQGPRLAQTSQSISPPGFNQGPNAESGAGSPPSCLDGSSRTGSSSKTRVNDKWKCWLWQNEVESLKTQQKEKRASFNREMTFLKVREAVRKQVIDDYNEAATQLEELAEKYTIMTQPSSKKKKKKKSGPRKKFCAIPSQELEKMFGRLNMANLQEVVFNSKKAALLTSKLKRGDKFDSPSENGQHSSTEVLLINMKKENDIQWKTLRYLNTEIEDLKKEFAKSHHRLQAADNDFSNCKNDVMEIDRATEDIKSKLHYATERKERLENMRDEMQTRERAYESLRAVGEQMPTLEEYFCKNPKIIKHRDMISRRAVNKHKEPCRKFI